MQEEYKHQYPPKVVKWTKSAIECYNLGCQCSKCELPESLETPCRMKGTVLELVRVFGKPPKYLEDIIEREDRE